MTALRWGHININVSHLETSVEFYRKLGLDVMMPGIPYLALSMKERTAIAQDALVPLGLPAGTEGRACIMQLGETFPKIDLIELLPPGPHGPLSNQDIGLVRLCLGSEALADDYERLLEDGVHFVSSPASANDGLADIAVCADPDGTLIEIIQPHLHKWGAWLS